MKNGWVDNLLGERFHYRNDLLHNENKPAVERPRNSFSFASFRLDGTTWRPEGFEEWWNNGKLHREDGPAVVNQSGNFWYFDGILHRRDGPAIELNDGEKKWYFKGNLNRLDGPAWIWPNGDSYWFLDNQMHREDGPAIECVDGNKWWYIRGVEVTERIVMRPQEITFQEIQKSRYTEFRTILIERYGWVRYLADSKAKILDKRDNAIENTKEALFVTRSFGNRLVVTCPTGRVFTLGVPSDIVTCEAAQRWLGSASGEVRIIGRT